MKTVPKLPNRIQVEIDGRLYTLYSIGWLGLMLNRSPHRLRQWERNGTLPRPILQDQLQETTRYYLAAEIQAYARIFKATPLLPGFAFPPALAQALGKARSDLKTSFIQNSMGNVSTELPETKALLERMAECRKNKKKRQVANVLNQINRT